MNERAELLLLLLLMMKCDDHELLFVCSIVVVSRIGKCVRSSNDVVNEKKQKKSCNF